MVSNSSAWVISVTQLIASIATAIAAAFVGWQTFVMRRQLKLAQQQMDSSSRPWLGAFEKGLQEYSKNNLLLRIKNYGSLPTTSLKWIVVFDDKTLNRDDMKSQPDSVFDSFKVTAVFPDQIWQNVVPVDENLLESAKTEDALLLVGVLMKYQYSGNRSGEYGIIFEYKKSIAAFGFNEVWAQ